MLHFVFLTILFCCVELSYGIVGVNLPQGYEPYEDFCRRYGHQSAVIGNRLFIDGGFVNELKDARNYSNSMLLYHDLTTTISPEGIDQGMPPLRSNLSKPSTVPSVYGGCLWPDMANEKLYLYGGQYDSGSPGVFQLWVYDAYLDVWSAVDDSSQSNSIVRAYDGAAVAVEDQGKAFYLGGYVGSESVLNWEGPPIALSSFLVYDMLQNNWRNQSGPDSTPRAEGALVYIPASDHGLLIAFGGIQTTSDGNPNNSTGVSMSQINIYDIASNRWYPQTATGDVPPPRRNFCAGAATAQDSSSHNIYIYGGASTPDDEAANPFGFDEVWILTIPAFQWIKWFPDSPGAANPHNTLTCNVIHGSQMLIVGGWFPNDTTIKTCDAEIVAGMHNLDMGQDNVNMTKWDSFNLTNSQYLVPTTIVEIIGGGPTGGAVLVSPQSYGASDLSVLLTRAATVSTRLPTRTFSSTTSTATSSNISGTTAGPTSTSPIVKTGKSKKTNIGAIVGGVVAGGVLVIAIFAFIFLCCRRRKHMPAPKPADPMGQMDSMGQVAHLPPSTNASISQNIFPSTTSLPPPVPSPRAAPLFYVTSLVDGALTPAYAYPGPSGVGMAPTSPPMPASVPAPFEPPMELSADEPSSVPWLSSGTTNHNQYPVTQRQYSYDSQAERIWKDSQGL